MNDNRYDTIIIGAGPGGMTAAIYSAREKLKTLILEKGICGGLVATTHLIENFPGFPDGVGGAELMEKFSKQAKRFGAEEHRFEEVTEIGLSENGDFMVRTVSAEYSAPTIILATGSVPKILGIPGEKELRGRGVSYCAVCDGLFFEGLDVAVIGCGNSGLQEGEGLLK
ncbi:thioredoxin-disulfide reductase, partial [bacterium]